MTGAYNITLEAKQMSDKADRIVRRAMNTVGDSEQNRNIVEREIARVESTFRSRLDSEKQKLDTLDQNVGDLDQRLMDINENVSGFKTVISILSSFFTFYSLSSPIYLLFFLLFFKLFFYYFFAIFFTI